MIALKQSFALCPEPSVLAGCVYIIPFYSNSSNLFDYCRLDKKTLTEKFLKAIISLSLPNEVIRSSSLSYGSDTALNPGTKNQGVGDYTTCRSLFLCPKSLLSTLKNLPLWWGGLSEQRLLDAAVQSDFLPRRPKIEPLRGGLQLNQGVAIMRNYAQEPTKSKKLTNPASLVSLFNLVKRTKKGNQVIYKNLSFAQAISRINQQTPPLLIKFSKMAVSK